MDIGSGYPSSSVNQSSAESGAESIAVVVEAQKDTSEAITLERVQISQYGDTVSVDNSPEKKVEPPNTYNKFGRLPSAGGSLTDKNI